MTQGATDTSNAQKLGTLHKLMVRFRDPNPHMAENAQRLFVKYCEKENIDLRFVELRQKGASVISAEDALMQMLNRAKIPTRDRLVALEGELDMVKLENLDLKERVKTLQTEVGSQRRIVKSVGKQIAKKEAEALRVVKRQMASTFTFYKTALAAVASPLHSSPVPAATFAVRAKAAFGDDYAEVIRRDLGVKAFDPDKPTKLVWLRVLVSALAVRPPRSRLRSH